MEAVKDIVNNLKFQERINDNLRKNFNESMKDLVFKKLVEKTGFKENELYNYTSRIDDSVNEYKTCAKCKGLLMCNNPVSGYINIPQNIEGVLEFNYVPCKYQKEFIKKTKHLENISLYEMPVEVKQASMRDVFLEDKRRVEAIKEVNFFYKEYKKGNNPKGIYLCGSFGSGKTYLVAALFNELAKDDIKSAIVYYPEFLRDLKSTFTSFNEKFEKIKKVPLLLLDDIGAEAVTAWGRDEVLGSLLQFRMQEHLPTFFTSNLSIKELEEHLSMTKESVDHLKARRIIERVKQLSKEVELISKNLRGK